MSEFGQREIKGEKESETEKGSKGVYCRVSSREIIYMICQAKVIDVLPCDTKNVRCAKSE